MPIYGLDIEGSFDLSSYTTAVSVLFSSDSFVYHTIKDNNGDEKVRFEPKVKIKINCFFREALKKIQKKT